MFSSVYLHLSQASFFEGVGGLFCNSCTLQRMVLHGQGDSPVRVCEPCKKLEEAARFEMQHGHPSRTGRGSSRSTYKNEDEIPNKNLGNDTKENFSSRLEGSNNIVSGSQGETSRVACSNAQEAVTQEERSNFVDGSDVLSSEIVNTTPE